ncbi:MAG: PleD family two-component system response regulator [Candidatus Methylomirabilales bacterium]
MMQRRPILVIDNDQGSCDTVTAILTDAGYHVLSAPFGLIGIEKARAIQPGVIIISMMMPATEGVHTCQRMKQDPVLRDIPVIGITGSADSVNTERAFGAGAQFFLPKPFGADSLVHMVGLAADSAQHFTLMRHRQHPRFEAEISVRCLVVNGGDAKTTREIAGHTVNVSLGGLLLLLFENLPPGTVLSLQLGLPEGSISADATVVWRSPNPRSDGKTSHGIRLLRFPKEAELVQYRRFLSEIAPDHPYSL